MHLLISRNNQILILIFTLSLFVLVTCVQCHLVSTERLKMFFCKTPLSISQNTLGSSPQIFHLLPKKLKLGIGLSRCLQYIKNDNLACPRSVSSSNLLHARLVCFQTGILLVLILPACLDPSGNWSFLPSSYGLFTFANKANAIHYAAPGLAELIDKQNIF